MLESLALALLETLASYLFEQKLERMGSVDIDGAPGWYAKDERGALCESVFAEGSLRALEQARADVEVALVKRVNGTVEVMIYDRFRHLKDPAERDLADSFKVDVDLPVFVRGRVEMRNEKYDEKRRMAFVRACLDGAKLLAYQKERMGKVRDAVVRKHARDAFDELDRSTPPGR